MKRAIGVIAQSINGQMIRRSHSGSVKCGTVASDRAKPPENHFSSSFKPETGKPLIVLKL
ncbi:MAG TPA: hypothetical protein PL124_12455 [Candidatus Cloacimonadota bacterium]|nr:hypothetical protein [Candidatus Cloacimonadota bacterium]